jgi:hypothetical protein
MEISGQNESVEKQINSVMSFATGNLDDLSNYSSTIYVSMQSDSE